MRELERIANLWNNGQRLARADATAGEELSQAHPVHKLHDEEIQSIRPAKIMDGNDAGVIELGQRPGFTGEPFGKRGVISNRGRQDLERHDAVEFLLPCFIDRSHSAAADQFDEFELREFSRQFLDARRRETRFLLAGYSPSSHCQFHQTSRAKAPRGVGGQRSLAILANLLYVHFHTITKRTIGVCYKIFFYP